MYVYIYFFFITDCGKLLFVFVWFIHHGFSLCLQDQFDNLEKHTQWGIEFVERYTKFVKERSEIEINYAKQIRWVPMKSCFSIDCYGNVMFP